jgi:hypothetical protein
MNMHRTHAWREYRASLDGARRCRLKGFVRPMQIYLVEASHWRREYLSLCRFNAALYARRASLA